MSDSELSTGYDHVAYATKDTDATVKLLTTLGFTVKIYKQEIEKFNVFITKMVSRDNHVAEIVEPRGAPSVVSKLLDGNEATIYHACFKTDDFEGARERLREAGAVTITKPMRIPYPVTEEHTTYWASHMYHPNLGLFEITGPEKERLADG
jgi:4-hydroxyphenylpyruvate dioxygenase-like putative hemolysin